MGQRVGCPKELLADTSSRTGTSTSTAQKPAPAPSARLKGKERKQAKAAAAATAAAAAALATDKPSEFISSSEIDKHKVDVPTTFTTAIERAISVRRSFENLLEQHGIDPKLENRVKHSFFVGVLEKVRDVLKPLFWKSTPGRAKDQAGVEEAVPITHEAGVTTRNPFEILEVYDVPEIDLEPTQQPKKATAESEKAIITVDYKAEETKEDEAFEMFLAFCTLFRDISAIRSRVRNLWLEYAQNSTTKKHLSLSAVAIATNTAIDLARRMEEDVAPLFAKHEHGMHGMLFSFFTAECAARGKDPFDFSPPDEYNLSVYGLIDHTMNNAARLLRGWSDSNPDGLSTYNGKFGWSKDNFDWQSASNAERWQQDKSSLMEMFPEFDMIGRMAYMPVPKEMGGHGQVIVIDELTRGLHEWLANGASARAKKLSLWLILATSIHWDIRRVLNGKEGRPELDRPYKEMKAVGIAVRGSIEATIEYHKNLKIVGWMPQHQKQLEQLLSDTRYWDGNPLFQALRMATGEGTEENMFLKRHPWYCGLWIHDVHTRMHHLGLALERAFGGILYTGHLYNALERQQLISQKWQDMELFYHLQGGRDKFFVGEAPSDPADYHKQLCMMMGFSASNFSTANRRNQGKMTATKAGPRALSPQARVSSLWLLKLTAASPRLNFAPEDVEAILQGGKSDRQKDGKHASQRVTAADLIGDLAYALQKEVPEITADYFSFHRTCWSLLREVRKAVYSNLIKWLGTPDFEAGEYQLPFIVGWIFRTVTGNAGASGGSQLPGIMPTMGLLEKAAKVYDGQKDTLGGSWTYFELRRMKLMASLVDLAMTVPDIDDSVPTRGDPLDSQLMGVFTSSVLASVRGSRESTSRSRQPTGNRRQRRNGPRSLLSVDDGLGNVIIPDYSNGPRYETTLPSGMPLVFTNLNQILGDDSEEDEWTDDDDEDDDEIDSGSDDEYHFE